MTRKKKTDSLDMKLVAVWIKHRRPVDLIYLWGQLSGADKSRFGRIIFDEQDTLRDRNDIPDSELLAFFTRSAKLRAFCSEQIEMFIDRLADAVKESFDKLVSSPADSGEQKE